MTATGTYINVYDELYDVYVILNEPNDTPKPSEVDQIAEVVKYHADQVYDSMETLENAIGIYLEGMDIPCLDFGFHVVALRYKAKEHLLRDGKTES